MTNTEEPSTESVSFGKWIHDQRIQKNISLEEIAAVTKVHISQLKHLEADEREKLPAPAFVRGFLISYARHLGLSEDEVLARFKEGQTTPPAGDPISRSLRAAQSTSQPKVRLVETSNLGHVPASRDMEKPKPKMLKAQNLLLAAGGLILIIGITMLIALGKKSRHDKKRAQTQSEEQAAATSAAPAAPAVVAALPTAKVTANEKEKSGSTTAPSTTASAAAVATSTKTESTSNDAKKYSFELRAVEQSWVNLRIDDKDSSGMILVPGQSYVFDADRKVILSLSDAGSVEIKWNGTWYAPPGFRGDVKSLTLPEQLTKLTPKSMAPKVAPKRKKKAPVVDPANPTDTLTPPAAATDAPPPADTGTPFVNQ